MLGDGDEAQDRLNDSPKVTGEVCRAVRKLAQLPRGPVTAPPAIQPPLLPIFYYHVAQTAAARSTPCLQVQSSAQRRDQHQEKKAKWEAARAEWVAAGHNPCKSFDVRLAGRD